MRTASPPGGDLLAPPSRRRPGSSDATPSVARATPRPPQGRATTQRGRTTAQGRSSAAGPGPSGRAGGGRRRQPGLDRTALRELTTVLAAGVAVVAVAALVAVPAPTGVALALGTVVSTSTGAAVLASWSRRAARGAADVAPTRPQAVAALVGSHAVAAVPVGLAILAAG